MAHLIHNSSITDLANIVIKWMWVYFLKCLLLILRIVQWYGKGEKRRRNRLAFYIRNLQIQNQGEYKMGTHCISQNTWTVYHMTKIMLLDYTFRKYRRVLFLFFAVCMSFPKLKPTFMVLIFVLASAFISHFVFDSSKKNGFVWDA